MLEQQPLTHIPASLSVIYCPCEASIRSQSASQLAVRPLRCPVCPLILNFISETNLEGFEANNTVRRSRRVRWFGVAPTAFPCQSLAVPRDKCFGSLERSRTKCVNPTWPRPAVFYPSIRQESFPGAKRGLRLDLSQSAEPARQDYSPVS